MGSDRHYPEEAPAHLRTVADFWIDETPVTNAAFAEFVKETGYVTQAEIAPDPAMYPGMDPALAAPASAVFVPPKPGASIAPLSWWHLTPDANWRNPLGPESSIIGLEDHPVVHIGYEDAKAYADWAGKALPTEQQWEYAARGGLNGADFAWGDEFEPGGVPQANYWQGLFPTQNSLRDGYARTSPVRSFARNSYGLCDMIGNVWEWTSDCYEGHHRLPKESKLSCCGPKTYSSTGNLDAKASVPVMVLKGGSYLCAENYCQRYRPAARHPQPMDTTTSHVGFRCVSVEV